MKTGKILKKQKIVSEFSVSKKTTHWKVIRNPTGNDYSVDGKAEKN